jgi:hypothetical protein
MNAPPRRPHTNGRPRKKGARLSALSAVLRSRRTPWARRTVPGWYGEISRDIDITSGTALWYSHSTALPIRWVLVRDPLGRFAPQALLSTDLALEPLAIVQFFVPAGEWRSRSRKPVAIWDSRRNGSGPITPSRGPRRASGARVGAV